MTVDGRVVFGANYDWDIRNGMIMVNKRSTSRESLTQRPARWVSLYASITFNQYGRDFPTGGMNEAGLVVALMDLEGTEYPAVDSRPSAGVLDWIQYQLDLSAARPVPARIRLRAHSRSSTRSASRIRAGASSTTPPPAP